jgi:hypothetical protein
MMCTTAHSCEHRRGCAPRVAPRTRNELLTSSLQFQLHCDPCLMLKDKRFLSTSHRRTSERVDAELLGRSYFTSLWIAGSGLPGGIPLLILTENSHAPVVQASLPPLL